MNLKSLIFMVALVLSAGTAFAEPLNVNSATFDELMANVPNLTEDQANGIIMYREDMGDIYDMSELLDVDGIDEGTLDVIKEHVGLEALSGAECSC